MKRVFQIFKVWIVYHMKKRFISIIVILFLLLLLLSSCASNSFKGLDVFNKQKMDSVDIKSLTEIFNKQYTNPVETDNETIWSIPIDTSEKGVKIYGYSIEKATIQNKDGNIGRVSFISPAFNWRVENTDADELQIINECNYFINKTINNLPITNAEFIASESINQAREYIDNFLNVVMEIEKKEMKNYKSKGKAFIDGEEWDSPFVMGRLLSVDYSIIDLERRYNECKKRLMVMNALEKGKSNLAYCWDGFYMSLNLYSATLTVEFGYNPGLAIE